MAKPITKPALVEHLASETGSTKKAARAFLDALSKVVTQRLVAGEAVALPNLVKFETRDRPARQVRSPATGALINKEADKTISARVRPILKTAVNA